MDVRVRYVWTGRFDLNPDTCGRSKFLNPKEKVADSKISRYVWTGPKFALFYLMFNL